MFGRKKKYERPVIEDIIIPDIPIDFTIRAVEEGEPCELGTQLSISMEGNSNPLIIAKIIRLLLDTLMNMGLNARQIDKLLEKEFDL